MLIFIKILKLNGNQNPGIPLTGSFSHEGKIRSSIKGLFNYISLSLGITNSITR
jgi:hypothetical protein